MSTKDLKAKRKRSKMRTKRKVLRTGALPRLCICKSPKHMTAQLVDDIEGKTLLGLSTVSKEVKKELKYGGNKSASKKLGKMLAEQALGKGIRQVRFDRSGYVFHGRVKEFADGCREAGLKF